VPRTPPVDAEEAGRRLIQVLDDDWADIEAVAERSPAQVEAAAEAVAGLVGGDDPACERLAAIVGAG
jgi:hypothetical protein